MHVSGMKVYIHGRLVEHLALRPACVGPMIAAVMLVIISLEPRAAIGSANSPPSSGPVTPAPLSPDAPPVLSGFPSTKQNPSAPCTCGDAKGMSGWCERHGI